MISTRYQQDAKAYMGADCVSDHNLVITKTLLKLNKTGRVTSTLGEMFLCLT